MTILMGRPYWTAVAISWMFIWMLPSPAMSTTTLSGQAICAEAPAAEPHAAQPAGGDEWLGVIEPVELRPTSGSGRPRW
jgi:hypothetical protein